MIEVLRTESGVTVKGHAGFAPHGQDIVCAAVSALVQNLVASVYELTDTEIQHHMQPGIAEIQYRNLSEGASLLVDSFFIGVRMIAESYPDHVRIVQAVEDTQKLRDTVQAWNTGKATEPDKQKS